MTLTTAWTIVIICLLGIPVAYILIAYLKRKRARKIMNQEFPEEWEVFLKKNLQLYEKLPKELQKRLQQLIHLIIATKEFEGCKGLEITDEIKVTIAGEAAVLILNKNIITPYPNLQTILVYPHAYFATSKQSVSGNLTLENLPSARLGESWQYGDVIVAWDHAKQGGRNMDDGHNVVFHEFSHQLDQETGSANGVPPMDSATFKTWGSVLGHDYLELCKKKSKHKKDVIDSYGATNPAEFFAVATEAFFEKPHQLYKAHEKLFEELKLYYKIDPRDFD